MKAERMWKDMSGREAIEIIKAVRDGAGKVRVDSVEEAIATLNVITALSMAVDALEKEYLRSCRRCKNKLTLICSDCSRPHTDFWKEENGD